MSSKTTTQGQPNLSKQDLSTLDVTKLTALSPEVISRQATINIGTIGHVAHGKSTVVKAVSGVQTVRFKNELERNITIKLDSGNPGQGKKRKRGEDEEYEVETVVDHEVVKGTVKRYMVKWKNWPSTSNTWEPPENLHGCLETVVKYFEELLYPGVEKIPYDYKVASLKEILSKFREEDFERYFRLFTVAGHKVPEVDLEETERMLVEAARLPAIARDETLMGELEQRFLFQELKRRRERQLENLHVWEEAMTALSSAPILVENAVDLEGPPVNFTFISYSFPGLNVTIPSDPPVGCDCTDCSSTPKSCCSRVYKEGRLSVGPGTPIYECNKACNCGPDCPNRVVQLGRKVSLQIFKTPNGCGWGVRTLEEIQKGQFVTEYVGEVVTRSEANKRDRQYDEIGSTYLFDLDFNDSKNFPFVIDGGCFGNESRFINHSCSPNLQIYSVWINCLDPNLPRLALFASRLIKAGEEISFDYLCKKTSNTNRKQDQRNQNLCVPCKCRSRNCRKFLFA